MEPNELPASPRNRLTFVGRERELAVLAARLGDTGRDEARVVLISGEPGVGKTRLLLEAAAAAEAQGWRVLLGHAYDSEGMPPYLPFIEALQDHVSHCPLEELKTQLGDGAAQVALILPEISRRLPDLPGSPQLDAESARYRLFESLSDFLEAIARSSECGLMLCLDDLHWADESTLLLLEHLARRLAGAPFLVIATYRGTDLDMAHPLARTLEQFTRQRLSERLDIRRLSQEEVAVMLASLGRPDPPPVLVDTIFSETEGNPFFVREVFEYLAEEGRLFSAAGVWRTDLRLSELDVPQGVLLVIGRRLQRLSEECRRVLGLASVLGRTFDYQLLRRLAELDEEALLGALEESQRAHLLESEAGGRLRFGHELMRQTLLKGLSLARRQRLHQRIATSLEDLYTGNLEPHLGELASHYRSAGAAADQQRAIDYSVLAAEAAQAVYAWDEAVTHYDGALQALELSGVKDDDRRCNLLLSLGQALIGGGRQGRIVNEVAPEALALAEAIGDSRRAFAACRLVMEATSDQTAQGWLEKAERFLGGDPRARIEFNLRKSPRSLHQGRFRESKDLLMEAMVLAREVGDAAAELRGASSLMRFGHLTAEEERELFEETRRLPLTDTSAKDLTGTRLDAVMIHLQDGQRDEAEAERRELAKLSSRTHHADSAFTASEVLFATLDGRLQEALEAAAAVSYASFPRVWRGRLAGWLGDLEALESELARNEGRSSYFAPGERAFFLAQAGRMEEAREVLEHIPDPAGETGEPAPNYGYRILLLETANISGAHEAAALLRERATGDPRRLAKPHFAFAGRHLAGAAALLGEFANARDTYREAIDFCEGLRYRPELALTRLELGQLLLRHYPRDRAEAIVHLDFAIAEFDAMGMQPALERAMRLRGRRPVREQQARAYPDGLSEREVEVLRLIAAGKSNQQIADELFISLNTVTHHVTNIFNKSGAANRTEAAAYAHRSGLT